MNWLVNHFIPRKTTAKYLLILAGHAVDSYEMIQAAANNDTMQLCLPIHTPCYCIYSSSTEHSSILWKPTLGALVINDSGPRKSSVATPVRYFPAPGLWWSCGIRFPSDRTSSDLKTVCHSWSRVPYTCYSYPQDNDEHRDFSVGDLEITLPSETTSALPPVIDELFLSSTQDKNESNYSEKSSQ
jgi:hypothetical protein